MYAPRSPYAQLAYDTIKSYLETGTLQDLDAIELPDLLLETSRGCFVSLHLENDELRGCIGTLEPHEKNLAEEIRRNAMSAAFHDQRFNPLSIEEFPTIKLSVDVLTEPERIYSTDDLDPFVYGLIITDGKFHRGVLLPSIPGIDSVEKQIQVVKRKAGLEMADERNLEFYRFSSNRYH